MWHYQTSFNKDVFLASADINREYFQGENFTGNRFWCRRVGLSLVQESNKDYGIYANYYWGLFDYKRSADVSTYL